MDMMSTISLIGIILGIALFIFLSFQGFPVVVNACLAALVVILLSGQPVMPMITDTWANGFSNFAKSYFLLLTVSAAIGKMMNDSGAARKIAVSLYGITRLSKRNPKFIAALVGPIIYTILTCAGISGFVVIFAVLGVSKQIMQEFDIPWRFYCYGGSLALCNMWIPGSLSTANIAATVKASGTSLAAAPLLGVVVTVVYWIVGLILLRFDLKTAEKKNEGFMETGAAFLQSPMAQTQSADETHLPSLLISVLPLGTAIVLAVIFEVDILICMFIGLILCSIFFGKYLLSYKKTLSDGISSAFSPVINAGCAVAVGSVITATPGFQIIISGLSKLPPVLEGIGYISIFCFIVASPMGGIHGMGGRAFECMMQSGLTAETASRLMALATFTGCPPHSSAIANTVSVTKLEYRKAMIVYLKVCFLGGVCAMAAALLMVYLGLVV